MANIKFTNNAISTLASGISAGASSLSVASGQGALFPSLGASEYFYCTLTNTGETVREIVKVTARSTDTFTITRAQEGTSASSWSTGDKVELRVTAQGLNDIAALGGVTSVNGSTGAVTGIAVTGANTFTGNQNYGDQQNSRAMFIDCGMTKVDKGNSGTSTQTLDYTAGHIQKITATGNHTIATSNWPPTGNRGVMILQLVNGGSYTITWPTVNWEKPDGTTTTTFSTWINAVTGRTALQSSGTDEFRIWSDDGGTTLYGKFA